ncbi:MAG: hypothetical protein LBV47_00950 [Bacteroidales bacterium]|nr:hypothetical protein [Bacteroidales bacterium]
MKTIILVLTVTVFGILVSCCKIFYSDEKLSMKRVDYNGNQLRLDGYYYYYNSNEDYTMISFLYRNGTVLSTRAYYLSNDLDAIEKRMIQEHESLRKDKTRWGVFTIFGSRIGYERWAAPDEGGLTVWRRSGHIENDTTYSITEEHFSYNNKKYDVNETWHFKQFDHKPDSTNNYIK